jgi:Uma2 family endonuclease
MATNLKLQAPWGEYVSHVGPMTAEQLERFPGEDGWIYELHQGRLIAMPGPGDEHSIVQARFFLTLGAYIAQNSLGILRGTGCYNLPLPNNTEELLCPGLSYVTPVKEATMPKRDSYLVGAPDLVIEIASPSDTHPALAAKAGVYLQAGVQLIWNVWPSVKIIEVWLPATPNVPANILRDGDTFTGLNVLPGFQCPVSALFA